MVRPGVMQVPLIHLDFKVPASGLPSISDWVTCFRSMIFSGLQLTREPLDIALPENRVNTALGTNSLRIVKGYSRATAAMFVLLAASDVDLSDDAAWPALEPLASVLQHVWFVPAVIAVMDDTKSLHFKNIELSLKG